MNPRGTNYEYSVPFVSSISNLVPPANTCCSPLTLLGVNSELDRSAISERLATPELPPLVVDSKTQPQGVVVAGHHEK